MLVMLSQKKMLYFFYCHGDTGLTRGTTYVTCKNQESLPFFFFFPDAYYRTLAGT